VEYESETINTIILQKYTYLRNKRNRNVHNTELYIMFLKYIDIQKDLVYFK